MVPLLIPQDLLKFVNLLPLLELPDVCLLLGVGDLLLEEEGLGLLFHDEEFGLELLEGVVLGGQHLFVAVELVGPGLLLGLLALDFELVFFVHLFEFGLKVSELLFGGF